VEGRVWGKSAPAGTAPLESLGKALGTLDAALTTFEHPEAHRYLKWDVIKMPWIEPHLGLFTDHQKAILSHFLSLFKAEVEPRQNQLRQSVIYNDANDYNILLDPANFVASEVISLIDYGDALYSCTVCDLAIAIAYAVMDKPDPLAAAAAVVRGYHRQYPLAGGRSRRSLSIGSRPVVHQRHRFRAEPLRTSRKRIPANQRPHRVGSA
jgi:Ser/Thr protein kinase RdoA (MazF antagonist)